MEDVFCIENVKINKSYKVLNVGIKDIKIKQRLMELGLIVGQTVRILQKSSLKKVVLIEINDYMLSVRCECLNGVKFKENL